MSLIVTVIILLILAGVSIRAISGDKGIINEAKETKTLAMMKDIEAGIDVVLVKAELKSNNVTMESVIKQLINEGLIDDESQVNQDTGDITIDDYVLEEKLADYVITPEEKYYGNKNTVVTNSSYFTFTVNETAGTATLTGVKDEYAVKTYYNGEATSYTAVIKDGENYVTDVVIPYEYVDENGKKYTVTGIGASAFGLKDSSDWDSALSNVDYTFKSFVLPNTITTIGSSAFRGTTSLESINIPSNVTSIEGYAFQECSGLASAIDISNVTNLGGRAFYKCTTLNSVQLGEEVPILNSAVFYGCTNLININIPNSVTTIGRYAFYECSSLKEVEIPDNVTKIEVQAFMKCTSLSSVNIPESVTTIETGVFSSCTSLTNIYIPDSVTSLGNSVFNTCKSLSSVNIPNTITSIGEGLFAGCSSLTTIEIPDSVTSIGKEAFRFCSKLSSINIPDNVTSIGSKAFQNCSGLTTVTLGTGLTTISEYAFQTCTKISSINIPESVTTIGAQVFGYWTANQTINCEILEANKPSGWDEKWDYYNSSTARKAALNWGVSM